MVDSLADICSMVREDVLNMIYSAGSGHPGSSLSAVEIIVALYFTGILKCDPFNPNKPDRDRFIISKGHAVPALYSVLSRMGFFAEEKLETLRKFKSSLQGHPRLGVTPGVDYSAGSLGQGLSVANGIALGFKKQGIENRIYCLLGDGELQEGQIWEAALTTAQLKLSGVCVIVDNNHVQLDGRTAAIKKMEPLPAKWESFGWNAIEVNGHDLDDMEYAYRETAKNGDRPSVIIAETIKGKGVSFMENNCDWHSNPPSREELEEALMEIRSASRVPGKERKMA